VALLGVFYEGADVVMVQELMRCSLKHYVQTQAQLSGSISWVPPHSVIINWASNIFEVHLSL
jgi:hypothetical protein